MSARRLKIKDIEETTSNKRSQVKPSKSQLKSEYRYYFVTLYRMVKAVPVGFQSTEIHLWKKWGFGIFNDCTYQAVDTLIYPEQIITLRN